MNKYTERLYNGIWKENPIFVQMLGLCPTPVSYTHLEENILKLQEAKKNLADQIVSKGGISFGELTKDDILKMIEESRP